MHDHGERKHRGVLPKNLRVEVLVVRNMPRRQTPVEVEGRSAFETYGIPTDLPIALMQGVHGP